MGSLFRLDLPFVFRTSEASAGNGQSKQVVVGQLPAAKDDAPGSILIIDDEEIARYLARQLFRGTRYLITEATGGIEGLERARFDRPHLVLLDINMPDRNGFEVLEDLKADSSTKDIPVVIHTSRPLTRDDLLRLKGRHAAILPKQLDNREQALTMIRDLLGEPHLFSKQ